MRRHNMYPPMNGTFSNDNLSDSNRPEDGDGINDSIAILMTYYVLVIVIGIPGNAIILAIYGRKKRKTSTDVLIIGQGIVDILACAFTPAFIVRCSFYSLVTTGLCRFAYLAETSSAFTSLFFTTVISVDRYLAVCRPLRRRLTKRSSVLTSVIVVCLGIGINIPGTVFEVVRPGAGDDKCIQTISYTATLMMSIIFVLLFALSLMTSSIMYVIIYAFLQKRVKIHNKLVGNVVPIATIQPSNCKEAKSISTDTSNSSVKINSKSPIVENISTDIASVKPNDHHYDNVTNSSNQSFQSLTLSSTRSPPSKRNNPEPDDSTQATILTPENADSSSFINRLCRRQRPNCPRVSKSKESDMGRKTTRMLLVITVYFFVTWMPQIVYSVLPKNVLMTLDRSRVLDTTFDIINSLRLTNHIVNVFVYSVINNAFRTSLRQMVSCRCKK
nr:D(2) dopamine receptor-like [Lytechinus pictus]